MPACEFKWRLLMVMLVSRHYNIFLVSSTLINRLYERLDLVNISVREPRHNGNYLLSLGTCWPRPGARSPQCYCKVILGCSQSEGNLTTPPSVYFISCQWTFCQVKWRNYQDKNRQLSQTTETKPGHFLFVNIFYFNIPDCWILMSQWWPGR